MNEDGTFDFDDFAAAIANSQELAEKLKAEDMRCKPKQIDEMLRNPPHYIFKDNENYKFWKWLKPLEVNDFYTFDDHVNKPEDNHRIFNDHAIFADWSDKNEVGDELEFKGMRHKTKHTAHGICRIVNRQQSQITECCYKDDVLHGLYRQFKDNEVHIRVYDNGEEISHQTYERNLTRKSEGGPHIVLIGETCWPADLKRKA